MLTTFKLKFILILCWLTRLSRAAPHPPVWFVNDLRMECVVQTWMGDECTRCFPRQNWKALGYSSEGCPGDYSDSTSETITYCHSSRSPPCCDAGFGSSGDCSLLAFDHDNEKCAISACLPDGWSRTDLGFPGCPYYQWVVLDETDCHDPCQDYPNCTTCLEQGCSWSFKELECTPYGGISLRGFPGTAYRDVCEGVQELVDTNEECKTIRSCQDCNLSSNCRWVDHCGGENSVGCEGCTSNFCEFPCSLNWNAPIREIEDEECSASLTCQAEDCESCMDQGCFWVASSSSRDWGSKCYKDCPNNALCEDTCPDTPTCFSSKEDLKDAVSQYMLDPFDQNSSVALTFGWPIGTWCVSNIQDFGYLFEGQSSFNEDISGWDMSNARNLTAMFKGCTTFNRPLQNWNTSQVENFELMFLDCTSFNQPLAAWDTSSATNMGGMFHSCSSFNQPLNDWAVGTVRSFQFMFFYCASFNQPLNKWDMSAAADLGDMFGYCDIFDQDVSSWDISNAYYMSYMFQNALLFNQDLSAWNISSARYLSGMFWGASAFSQGLCSWGKHWRRDVNVSVQYMFTDSNCPERGDPDTDANPIGPLCMPCDEQICRDPANNLGVGKLCLFDEDLCVDQEDHVHYLSCCKHYNNKYIPDGSDCSQTVLFSDPCEIRPGETCTESWALARCFDDNDDFIDMYCCPFTRQYNLRTQWCICFSGENMVHEQTKGLIKMKDLEIGDSVKVDKETFDRVYGFGHYDATGIAQFYQIHVAGTKRPLELTHNHMIFVPTGTEPKSIPAATIKVGDQVVLEDGRTTGLVTDINMVERPGLYAPFTESGRLVVSGVLASSYVSLQPRTEKLKIGPYTTPFSMQWLGHAFTFHRRLYCRYRTVCQEEEYDGETRMPSWVSGPYRFFIWLLDQSWVLQMVVLVPFILYSSFVSLIDSMSLSNAVFAILLMTAVLNKGVLLRDKAKAV